VKLKEKIAYVFLSVSILAVFLTGIASVVIVRAALTDQTMKHLRSTAEIQKHRIEYILGLFVKRSRELTDSAVIGQALSADGSAPGANAARVSGILRMFKSLNPDFDSLSFVGPSGVILASSEPGIIGTTNYNKQAFRLGLLRPNRNVTEYDTGDREIKGYFSAPVLFRKRLVAVLVGKIGMDDILDPMEDYAGLGRTGETLLAKKGEKGDAVFITPTRHQVGPDNRVTVPAARDKVPINQALSGKVVDLKKARDYRDVEVIAATEYLPETGWGLVVKIDRSEALAASRRVEVLIFVFVLLFSVLAVLLASYFSGQITAPISELTVIARELSRGDHLARANIIPDDEIGDLARAFNRMVDNIESANRKLVQAKRLSDIGLFASFVAHELRNPLAVITIAMANIRKHVDLGAARRSVDNIEKKLAESGQIINNLLSFSRIKDLKPEPCLLRDLVVEVVDAFGERAEKAGVRLVHSLEPIRNTTIVIDRVQIGEVFFNLLSNAFDAIEKEGLVEVGGTVAGDTVEIAVRDSGSGIDPKSRESLFEPFFTTKGKGTGLGLAVCLRIVQLHRGEIRVSSEKGNGSEFTVVLPLGPPAG
jgi:signal transduction histidine kinase